MIKRKKPTKTKPSLGWVSLTEANPKRPVTITGKILNSNRLRVEERREIEFVEKLQANSEALIEQVRRVAAQQAGRCTNAKSAASNFSAFIRRA